MKKLQTAILAALMTTVTISSMADTVMVMNQSKHVIQIQVQQAYKKSGEQTIYGYPVQLKLRANKSIPIKVLTKPGYLSGLVVSAIQTPDLQWKKLPRKFGVKPQQGCWRSVHSLNKNPHLVLKEVLTYRTHARFSCKNH